MALWNKGFNGAGPLMLAGVAAMVLAPTLLRLAGRATRPVARTALRSGVDAYERTREGLGGLVEESRAEMESRGARGRPRARSKRGAADEHGAKT